MLTLQNTEEESTSHPFQFQMKRYQADVLSVTLWSNAAIVQNKVSITRATFGRFLAAIVATSVDFLQYYVPVCHVSPPGFSSDRVPAFSRATQRILPHPDGTSKMINFVLTQSRVSIQKRRRILQLAKSNVDFSTLNHASWSDSGLRSLLATAASSLDQLEVNSSFGRNPWILDDYEACWAVLQAIYMDTIYLNPTRYNFFRLIRMGNGFSDLDRVSLCHQ